MQIALCFAILAVAAAEDIQSSINGAGADWPGGNPLRFLGITKTLATTTTIVELNTVYVHQTCTVVAAGTPPCAVAPPTTTPAPTTTTTTVTPSPTTTTTSKPTTPAKPLFQLIPGGVSPLLSGSVTINKVNPPTLQVNLPQMGSGGGSGGGFNLFGNKPPLNVSLAAGLAATINSGSKGAAAAAGGAAAAGSRQLRPKSLEDLIQPSIVKNLEITAVPELRSDPDSLAAAHLEASQFGQQDEHDEFQIYGLSPQHMANRALPNLFGPPITIVKLARVTVTVPQVVTSIFPVVAPTDRVTLTISGCIPNSPPAIWTAC